LGDTQQTQRLYHYTAAKYALEDIRLKRLKIAQFSDLNDPFELMCVDVSRTTDELAFKLCKARVAERFGLLCFSKSSTNILLWSHYAERHKGICLGFDVTNFKSKFGEVEYTSRKIQFPKPEELNQKFMWTVLRSKYLHWKYEGEWRVFVELDTPEWNECAQRNLFFAGFSGELALREVILGAEHKDCDTLNDIKIALAAYPEKVEVSQLMPSPTEFELLKNVI
jgi:hypothetical protein